MDKCKIIAPPPGFEKDSSDKFKWRTVYFGPAEWEESNFEDSGCTWEEVEFKKRIFISKEPIVLNTEFLKENFNAVVITNNTKVRRPLMLWAAERGYLEVIKCLRENGAAFIPWMSRIIGNAAEGGYLDIIKYIADEDFNTIINNNYILTVALNHSHLELIKYLLNLNIYPEEFVHRHWPYQQGEISELMKNYIQFPNTKACKK